jgi:hypothetical protein
LTQADEALARDKPAKAWDIIRKIERLMGEKWPVERYLPEWNLIAARVALANGHFQLAHDWALQAEKQLSNPPDNAKLRPANRTYLIYYAVMLSRWARRDLGEALPDKILYYPPMSDADVEAVHPRLRRDFPLVKGGTAP